MAEAKCGSCGSDVLFGMKGDSTSATTICPGCGVALQVKDVEGVGTVFYPEAMARDVPAAPEQLDPYRTGTILLKVEETKKLAKPLEVKVRGYLSQEGAPPGEADFRLRSECTVLGRENGDITIPDQAISARHLAIEERGSEFFLRDLESSNGTFLNGHKIRSAKLASGDRVRAGNTTFTFSIRHIIPLGA